jgi:hypothetical protein
MVVILTLFPLPILDYFMRFMRFSIPRLLNL